jgi:hypothetical protein
MQKIVLNDFMDYELHSFPEQVAHFKLMTCQSTFKVARHNPGEPPFLIEFTLAIVLWLRPQNLRLI